MIAGNKAYRWVPTLLLFTFLSACAIGPPAGAVDAAMRKMEELSTGPGRMGDDFIFAPEEITVGKFEEVQPSLGEANAGMQEKWCIELGFPVYSEITESYFDLRLANLAISDGSEWESFILNPTNEDDTDIESFEETWNRCLTMNLIGE